MKITIIMLVEDRLLPIPDEVVSAQDYGWETVRPQAGPLVHGVVHALRGEDTDFVKWLQDKGEVWTCTNPLIGNWSSAAIAPNEQLKGEPIQAEATKATEVPLSKGQQYQAHLNREKAARRQDLLVRLYAVYLADYPQISDIRIRSKHGHIHVFLSDMKAPTLFIKEENLEDFLQQQERRPLTQTKVTYQKVETPL